MATLLEKMEYRQTIKNLKAYLSQLGLNDDPPQDRVTIASGTEDIGRPLGGELPVYPDSECGIDEQSIGKTLFNLKALIGFTPPTSK